MSRIFVTSSHVSGAAHKVLNDRCTTKSKKFGVPLQMFGKNVVGGSPRLSSGCTLDLQGRRGWTLPLSSIMNARCDCLCVPCTGRRSRKKFMSRIKIDEVKNNSWTLLDNARLLRLKNRSSGSRHAS